MHLRGQVLHKDIELDWYPELKAGLEDIFNLQVSLVTLARSLERDLLIYEKAPNKFKVLFKDDVFTGLDENIELSSEDEDVPHLKHNT